ncbi:hypothetical protein RHMOL_Rhmol02G0273800 [Rhododendron molle]|uniref:Uncharacterized protein n=1 Tax=Rhododendron molle TaxID=49168 RepID=A0ACC0PW34_RHOML|nr:hypothetical protein RHMOL_Rhmol02G0273800 [Rhododendron molle]
MSLSEKEEKELEKQLDLLNKPPVTTIHTDYGDIIDCVDFYKQPAFDHPLLKNHTFHYQMKPISIDRGTRNEVSSEFAEPTSIGLKGGGCPVGTIPLRRITKEDLIRERLGLKVTSLENNTLGAHEAVVRTRANSNKKLRGAGAYISVHAPLIDIYGRSSGAKMKIQNGPDSIEVGWRVDPSLYGDTRTRFFIRLDAGQSHCFNTKCPGFVIVRPDIPVDSVLDLISHVGGPYFYVVAYIVRDQPNGNWWLLVGRNNIPIGFWPQQLFTGLRDLANHVEWGGETFAPPGKAAPPMGSGLLPFGTTRVDAHFKFVSVLNEYRQAVDVENTEEFTDDYNLYRVRDQGIGRNLGRYFVYGGPGRI